MENGDTVYADYSCWELTITVACVFQERSIVLSTYIMCGFSNLSSCGICIGTLSALAPSRMHDINKHVVLACVAGNIANFLTACVAGKWRSKEWFAIRPGDNGLPWSDGPMG